MFHNILTAALILTSSLASALPSTHLLQTRATSAVDALLVLAPQSSSCASAAFASECRTATQAAPFLLQAFFDYKIYDPPIMAAILSTIAFESGDFQYNIHHYPTTVAGQGTRNMQGATYNIAYANSIPALASAVASSGGDANTIMNLVLPDEYSFASGVWFFATQCSAAIQAGVLTGGQTGWAAYLTGCVGTTATDDRVAGWKLANMAFGL